jgi:hypothetical protein
MTVCPGWTPWTPGPFPSITPQGWQCPNCKRLHAPALLTCPYCQPLLATAQEASVDGSTTDAFAHRNIVGRWLRLRGMHIEESQGLSEYLVPKDKQAQLFQQLAADAEHSGLLVDLFNGKEPLPFDEWKEKHGRN